MARGLATRDEELALLDVIISSSGADLDNQLELSSVEYQQRNEKQEIFIPVGERLGGKLIEFHNVSKSFGDRWFLNRICSHILACGGDSQWTFFSGHDHGYEEDQRRHFGEEASRPKRIRYRPITR